MVNMFSVVHLHNHNSRICAGPTGFYIGVDTSSSKVLELCAGFDKFRANMSCNISAEQRISEVGG